MLLCVAHRGTGIIGWSPCITHGTARRFGCLVPGWCEDKAASAALQRALVLCVILCDCWRCAGESASAAEPPMTAVDSTTSISIQQMRQDRRHQHLRLHFGTAGRRLCAVKGAMRCFHRHSVLRSFVTRGGLVLKQTERVDKACRCEPEFELGSRPARRN